MHIQNVHKTLTKNDIASLMVQLKTPEQLGLQRASHISTL